MSDADMDDWGFDLHAMYRIYDPFGRPLYFGETDNLSRRINEHMEKAWFRRPEITIKVTWFPNRAEAYAAQNRAIETEKPWHNRAGLKPATEQRPAPLKVAAKPKPVKRRDLIADLRVVLGDTADRVRLSALPHLLRQLAPDWEPYQHMDGVKLRAALAARGVRTVNPGNVPQLDPADLTVADRKAG